jgi:hypothetical protein
LNRLCWHTALVPDSPFRDDHWHHERLERTHHRRTSASQRCQRNGPLPPRQASRRSSRNQTSSAPVCGTCATRCATGSRRRSGSDRGVRAAASNTGSTTRKSHAAEPICAASHQW